MTDIAATRSARGTPESEPQSPARRRAAPAAALASVAVVLVLAGCSSSLSSTATTGGGSAVPHGSGSATASTLAGEASTWRVALTSQDKRVHSVGPGTTMAYGWNLLVGQTLVDGRTAEVELMGSVDYTSGSGPWWGFLTMTSPDARLGFRATGDAVFDPATKDTAFTATLEVIGGTGRYANAGGSATVVGTRSEALGGQVDLEISMTLTGVSV